METEHHGRVQTGPGQEAQSCCLEDSMTTPADDNETITSRGMNDESSDNANGSDMDGPFAERNEDVFDFSISSEQRRMKLPTTPATEKRRALDDSKDYFQFEVPPKAQREVRSSLELNQVPDDLSTPPTVAPSSPAVMKKEGEEEKTSIQPATLPLSSEHQDKSNMNHEGRHSAASPSLVASMKKLLPDVPSFSLPTRRISSAFGSASKVQSVNPLSRPKRSSTLLSRNDSSMPGWTAFSDKPRTSLPRASPGSKWQHDTAHSPAADHNENSQKHGTSGRNPAAELAIPNSPHSRRMVRRVTSDISLFVRHDLHKTSTRDEPEKWEDVSEQINARFKAITDSLQDSSITRIPKLPSVRLTSLKPGSLKAGSIGAQFHSGPTGIEPAKNKSAGSPSLPTHLQTSGPKKKKQAHPILHAAMSEMRGDVVVLGGYRGSILRSAKPPNKQLWVPVKVGMNLRRVDLEVGLSDEDEEKMPETIVPSGVLSHIGPVDICRRLLRHLKKSSSARLGTLRVHDWGYDWRLSPQRLSRQLIKFLESLECNRSSTRDPRSGALVIAHSLGGMITRHAVNQRPDLFAGVLYAGVPQHCINILGPLRNGDDVLLSSRVLTAQVNFTIRTSFALLPEDGRCFIDKTTGERYDLDLFDTKTWQVHALSPCIAACQASVVDESRKGIISTLSDSLPSLPFTGKRNSSVPQDASPTAVSSPAIGDTIDAFDASAKNVDEKTFHGLPPHVQQDLGPSIGNASKSSHKESNAMASTIPLPDALTYLDRTLKSVRQFKQELAFNPLHQTHDMYPPISVLYSSCVPTVFAARVDGRDAIKRSDAFDNLAFAAGDGIVLSKSARPPEGYKIVKGGLVESQRGHIGLLGDLEAVGRCLQAIVDARRRGVGTGKFAKP